MKSSSLFLVFTFFLVFAAVSPAEEAVLQKLLWTCSGGNPARITEFCTAQVREKIDKKTLDGSTALEFLKDEDLIRHCYAAHFFSMTKGGKGVIAFEELKDKEFARWFLEKPAHLEKLVFAQCADKNVLTQLHKIWQMEKKKIDEKWATLALGVALASEKNDPGLCLEKYFFYKDAQKAGKLFPQFSTMEPWEAALLLFGKEEVDELSWGQEYLEQKKEITPTNIAGKACSFIPYRDKNKNGVSVQTGAPFYDYKPITLQIYIEYGGVCGAVSKGACKFLKSKGIPCYEIGQPGHCAFLWKAPDGAWKIGNNIYGWNWCSGGRALPWKGPTEIIHTLSRFQLHGRVSESNLYYHLALLSQKPRNTTFLLQKSLEQNPLHLPAWLAYAELAMKGAKETDILSFLDNMREAFADDPYATRFLAKKFAPVRWKKQFPYKYCRLFLTQKEQKDSQENFLQEFWLQACQEIPDLKKSPQFDAKTRRVFFKKWLEHAKKSPYSENSRKRICLLMETILTELLAHEQTCQQFLEQYSSLISLWKDKSCTQSALKFADSRLKIKNLPTELKRHLSTFGMNVAASQNDSKRKKLYEDLLRQLPPVENKAN